MQVKHLALARHIARASRMPVSPLLPHAYKPCSGPPRAIEGHMAPAPQEFMVQVDHRVRYPNGETEAHFLVLHLSWELRILEGS